MASSFIRDEEARPLIVLPRSDHRPPVAPPILRGSTVVRGPPLLGRSSPEAQQRCRTSSRTAREEAAGSKASWREGLARPSARVQLREPSQKAAHAAEAAAFQMSVAAEGTPIRHEALL